MTDRIEKVARPDKHLRNEIARRLLRLKAEKKHLVALLAIYRCQDIVASFQPDCRRYRRVG